MRHDMKRVIITPARSLSGDKSAKTRQKVDVRLFQRESWRPRQPGVTRWQDPEGPEEDVWGEDIDTGPRRAPWSRYRRQGWNWREFTDLLNPLRRYLIKQVGRPWNAVWSEICAHADDRNVAGSHLRDHVLSMVETRTYLGDDGLVYQPESLYRVGFGVVGLYVHPVTGILRYESPRRRPRA